MSDQPEIADDGIQVPIVWVGLDELPVVMANNFVAQFDEGDEFILTCGHVTPPMIFGNTVEERLAQARDIGFIPARGVARIGMTRARVEQLVQILQQNLTNHDAARRGAG